MRRSLSLTATSLGLLLLGAVPAAACPDHSSALDEAGGFIAAIVETVVAAAF